MALRVNKKEMKIWQLTIDGPAEQVKPRRPKRQIELEMQGLLFDHIRDRTPKYPLLARIFATLNGVYIPPHLLAPIKRAGLVKGILDIWVIVPRTDPDEGHSCGLVIDLKTKDGRVSPEQSDWIAYLGSCGWNVAVCVGAWEAWQEICRQVGIEGKDRAASDLKQREETMLRMLES